MFSGSAWTQACPALLNIPAGYQGVVDFQLKSFASPQTRHVRGTISGGPDVGRQVTLFGRSGTFSAAILYDGTFDVADVVPGSYSLTATAFQDDVRYFAALPVEVGSADVTGLQVHLEAGMNVPGTVKVFSVSGIKNAGSSVFGNSNIVHSACWAFAYPDRVGR